MRSLCMLACRRRWIGSTPIATRIHLPTLHQRPMKKASKNETAANVGYESQLWQMADALRGSMDAAEYKHAVLGLIFLKYISDAFEEQHARLDAEKANGADPEDPDEYRALSIFWVPRRAGRTEGPGPAAHDR